MANTATSTRSSSSSPSARSSRAARRPSVLSFSDSATLAKAVARKLGGRFAQVTASHYPAGEHELSLPTHVAKTVYVVASVTETPDAFFKVLVVGRALRERGASEVVLLAPWIAYGRQDKEEGKDVAAGLSVGALLACVYDRIVTCDAHSDAFIGAFDGRMVNVLPVPRAKEHEKVDVVVAPDAGSEARVGAVAAWLGKPVVQLKKHRKDDTVSTDVMTAHDRATVAGKSVLIVDDVADSGGTLVGAATVLRDAGAAHVYAHLTHAVDADALRKRTARTIDGITVTIPHEEQEGHGAAVVAALVAGAHAERPLAPFVLSSATSSHTGKGARKVRTRHFTLCSGQIELDADLMVPRAPKGLVIFAHGSGSSRRSPRNGMIAKRLRNMGFATLLFDLLTPSEMQEYGERVFDIDALTVRLENAVRMMVTDKDTADLPIALMGSSTGAAAALNVAARLPSDVRAVISRGGRPDLARQQSLDAITAPTLFIVGGDDTDVLEWSRPPFAKLRCPKTLFLVPGATHLFEEPGTMDTATDAIAAWFTNQLS